MDHDAARSMAKASLKVLTEHDRGLELANGVDPMNLSNHRLGTLASMYPEELRVEQDRVEEVVRSNIGAQNINRAHMLFNLVELVPFQAKQ
jgi:hypothetical protein